MEQPEPFYNDLKQLRVAQGITLEQISARTRINTKFLKALEDGQFDVLPITYIRLFLRSYCEEVGTDFGDVVKKLEQHIGQPAIPVFYDEGDSAEAIGITKAVEGSSESEELAHRAPARLRRDFVTGVVIVVFLVIMTIFARRAYVISPLPPSRESAPATSIPHTPPPVPAPADAIGAEANTAPVARGIPARTNQPIVPVESIIQLPAELFSADRIIAHLSEKVDITPPIRLTLFSRDNVVVQPLSGGDPGAPFNITVAEARIWVIQQELILRTADIHQLRGDLNGIPINFGEARGLGELKIMPDGTYEVSGFAPAP